MRFQIEFTDVAEMEVQDALLWFLGNSPEYAGVWQDGLEQAVASLESFPTRCPLARESALFGIQVRQLLYRSHRILFTLIDADDDGNPDTVRILHVRHVSRGPLGDSYD